MVVQGCDSIHGVGAHIPTRLVVTCREGITVPLGPLSKDTSRRHGVNYNEFITFDPTRVRIRYLVLVKTKSSSKS